MKRLIVNALLMACVWSFIPITAQAAFVEVSFGRITSNSAENVAGQLGAQVRDAAAASSAFGLSLASDEVLFTFTNAVGIASNIAEVYFDDGTIMSQSSVENSLTGFTDFSGTPLNPANLPGGNNASPPFVATAGFGADVNPGPPSKGINAAADTLGIVVALQAGLDFNDVVSALRDGSLRLGLHVRSIGSGGTSDSFVNSHVPVPAALWLFASGLLGLVPFSRRQRDVA